MGAESLLPSPCLLDSDIQFKGIYRCVVEEDGYGYFFIERDS